MINIIIVSDILFYREGLEVILDRHESIKVVDTAFNLENTIRKINQYSPDIVLLDMTMIASCNIVDNLSSLYPETKFVALAVTEDEDTILTCAKAGISGYVSRDASIEQLINAICGVYRGELYCPRRIAASLFHKLKLIPHLGETSTNTIMVQSPDQKLIVLTQREKQIALLLSEGLSNKQIARNLTIEISTVKNHVHNILSKMGVHSRIQAATLLQRHTLSD